MIWAAIKAFLAKPIWRAVGAALGRVPVWVWVALAAIALVLIYGHHREGVGYGKASEHYQAIAAKLEAERQAALDSEEQALRQITKDTDNAITESRIANSTTVERFIARGGVRQACPDNRPAPDRSAGGGEAVHQAPILDDAKPLPVVTVLAEDVRVCTDNTIMAEGLRAFVLGLENRAGE